MRNLIKVLQNLFLPFEWCWNKCTYLGHNWEIYSTTKVIMLFTFGSSNKKKRKLKDRLYYRECKRCNKKETKLAISRKLWKEVSECPKEIKKYLNQKDLNSEEKKELEEYMNNMYDL